jgi:hypothetical protein
MSVRRSASRSATRSPVKLDTSKYSGKSLADLRSYRLKEINSLRLEEVKVIDQAILELSTDNTQRVIDDAKAFLNTHIDQAYVDFQTTIDNARSRHEADVNADRTHLNELFQSASQRHLEELTSLETARAIRLARSEQRGSAVHHEMTRKAINLARNHDVDTAIEVRDQANTLVVFELEQRAEGVNDHFDVIISQASEKHLIELQILENELKRKIGEKDQEFDAFTKNAQRKLAALVVRLLRGQVAEGSEKLQKLEKRGVLHEALTEFVQDKLTREDRTIALTGE